MNTLAFRQFICRACGLIYDEAKGDEDSGLAAGTRFDDIPDDWACPLCGVTKADFEPYETVAVQSMAAARGAGRSGGRLTGRLTGQLAGPITGRGMAGVVIVGGGTAAWSLVERLRALDAHRPITMVAACSADRYDKPRLSVACRQGVQAQALPFETGAAAAARLGIHLLAHTHAVGVDATTRRLRTTRGTLRYGELVLAHGARPRACPGLPPELTWRINDLRSYAGLRHSLAEGGTLKDVLIVGAGLVGCELANDLALAGHRLTLLDSAERPLPMATEAQSQALLQAWSNIPIRFIGGVAVTAARAQEGGGVAVELSTGETLTVALLISAVGLSTPSRLAEQAGLRWVEGIAVDPGTLETGVAHVHALGDCISLHGRPQRYIEPIHRQARVLAARLCGHAAEPYSAAAPVVRVKTSSLPLTLAA